MNSFSYYTIKYDKILAIKGLMTCNTHIKGALFELFLENLNAKIKTKPKLIIGKPESKTDN